jgi:hypothetical protein
MMPSLGLEDMGNENWNFLILWDAGCNDNPPIIELYKLWFARPRMWIVVRFHRLDQANIH